MKKYLGIRQVDKNTFEINFRPSKGAERVFRRIQAKSKQEASAKRAELIVETRSAIGSGNSGRETTNFYDIWQALESNLRADRLPVKTYGRYKNVYFRLFNDFRLKNFASVQTPNQLNLSFFVEYKGYYVNDLDHPNGWRAELIIVKAIMSRLYRLGFCSETIIKSLREIKKPRSIKKYYPDIPNTHIKELMGEVKKVRLDLYRPVYFMLRTGRRVEETTLIEKKDIVWNGINPVSINIRAETTKNKDRAPLKLLDSELQNFIRQAYKESIKYKTPLLFQNRQLKKCNQRRITEVLKKISMEVIQVKLTSHYFRHRFFTECGKANLPFIDVMTVSGLKDIKVLIEYYFHSTNEGQIKVLEHTRI